MHDMAKHSALPNPKGASSQPQFSFPLCSSQVSDTRVTSQIEKKACFEISVLQTGGTQLILL